MNLCFRDFKRQVGRIARFNVIVVECGALAEIADKPVIHHRRLPTEEGEIVPVKVSAQLEQQVSLECLFNRLLTVKRHSHFISAPGQQDAGTLQVAERFFQPLVIILAVCVTLPTSRHKAPFPSSQSQMHSCRCL